MKITANKKIKLSRKEWENIGKKAGWMRIAEAVIDQWEENGTKYYSIDELVIEGVPDTDKYSDLDFTEVDKGFRVIGGDLGDLLHEGYSIDEPGNRTYIMKPVLRTSLDLNSDEAVEIAHSIVNETFESIGWETLYHS